MPPHTGTATILAALLLTGLAAPESAAQGPDPTGLWLTEDETAVIAIQECPDGLCGEIHWLAEEGREYDDENPDPDLRDRPLCGLEILSGFERHPRRDYEWRDGEVYAADEGRTYSGRIRVEGADELELRGYRGVALIGRSQMWVRVSEDDYPRCEPPQGSAARGDGSGRRGAR